MPSGSENMIGVKLYSMLCSNAFSGRYWSSVVARSVAMLNETTYNLSVMVVCSMLCSSALRLCRVTLHTSAFPLLPCSLCGCSCVSVVRKGNTLQLVNHCDDFVHGMAGDGFHRLDV